MSNTPIFDEVNQNILLATKSAYERGRIETRLAIADELRNATKKPPQWIIKFIERLERGEIG